MSLSQIPEHAGEWLRGNGPHGEVVISSRIRYARNLAGFPFVHRANRRQQIEVMHLIKDEVQAQRLADNIIWVDMAASPSLDRQLLVERHLVSRDLAAEKNDWPRGVVIAPDETFAAMINEEDHLRLQVLRSGMQLSEAFQQIERLDNALEAGLEYAYSKRFGYLSACPTNVGTGLRVSVMLHLPALKLTGEIEKVRRAARDTHLAVRGLFGEGSEALGDFYQVSNQSTLGKTEQEIVSDFEHTIVPQVIAYEQQARQALLKQRPAQLDDKIYRAWALLTHARVMGTEEVLSLLSHLRLGVNLGRLTSVDLRTINELLLLTQPAHLQRLVGRTMDPAERKIARADLVRQRLKPGGQG
ncbi:MAG: protein arginine kinase [Phycisphaeraceae bacterium]